MRRLNLRFGFRALVVTTIVLGAGAAFAADPVRNPERLVIGRIDWAGNVPQPLRKTLVDKLTAGLTAVAFQVMRPPEGPSADSMGPGQTCEDADCWRQAAVSAGVSYLISLKVEEQDKTFAITLELISGRSGAVVGTNRERCEICGAEEVGEKMSLAAATLRTRLQSLAEAPARFVIRTRPDGARVKLDGKAVGQTPIDVHLKSGEHQVVIEREGFSPLERTFSVTSGVDETLDLDLVRLPTQFPFGVAGWTAIGAGVAMAAGGLYFLSRDGDEVSCTKTQMDLDGDCPEVYDTKILGASLLGLSAVSVTLGGVWLYLDQPQGGGLLNRERDDRAQTTKFLLGTSGRF